MSQKFRLASKVVFYCFWIVIVQTSLITDQFPLQINLVFCSLMIFASLFGFFENLVAGIFFCVFSSMLFYNSDIYWFYPIFSIVASKINPEQIQDKFLVCILYVILITPIYEIFNPLNISYTDRLIENVLINVATMTPLFVITKFFFKERRYKPLEAF